MPPSGGILKRMDMHTTTHRNMRICIRPDYDMESPYEAHENLMHICHWSRKGFFGEEVRGLANECPTVESLKDFLIKDRDLAICLPFYIYEHGGQSISLTPYECTWDSSHGGFVTVSRQAIRDAFGLQRISAKALDKARRVVEAEIECLNEYLVYGAHAYCIEDEEGEFVDACGGFYGGDYTKAINEAKNAIDYVLKLRAA